MEVVWARETEMGLFLLMGTGGREVREHTAVINEIEDAHLSFDCPTSQIDHYSCTMSIPDNTLSR